MRICFLAAGTFTHIGSYLDYFKHAGHDVHFISLSPSPERAIPVYNIGFGKKYSKTQGKWKYPLSMLRIKKVLKEINPDILHAHYATSAGLTALVSSFHPAVVTIHGSDLIENISSPIWKPLLKRIFNYADCVNPVSEYLGDIVSSLDISGEKIEVITPGVDTEMFQFADCPKIDESHVLKLVCTRRMEPVFDHNTIIQALSLLKRKGIDFEMSFIGNGSLLGELKQQVRKLNLHNNISFIRKVPNKELPELLAQNHIYLSASLWDGASISLLEAMATGLFPIVSDIKANSEWLVNGKNAYLHKLKDAEDLADCILKFLEKPEIFEKAHLNNRQTIIQKADRNKNFKRLESIYQKLVSKAR